MRLGKYEIRAEIGRGGMGAVYKGYDPMLDSWVAVKVLAPHLVWEKEFIERFIHEARAARKLRHPGIVTVYDVGQEAGWFYTVMEYLEGRTLTDVIEQWGPFPLDEVLPILRPLAEALDHAYHQGLVHRDVKPSNVIVGPTGQVVLTDLDRTGGGGNATDSEGNGAWHAGVHIAGAGQETDSGRPERPVQPGGGGLRDAERAGAF